MLGFSGLGLSLEQPDGSEAASEATVVVLIKLRRVIILIHFYNVSVDIERGLVLPIGKHSQMMATPLFRSWHPVIENYGLFGGGEPLEVLCLFCPL